MFKFNKRIWGKRRGRRGTSPTGKQGMREARRIMNAYRKGKYF